jgi:hypothetical protein
MGEDTSKPPVPTERAVQRAILAMAKVCFPDVLIHHSPGGAHLAGNNTSRFKQMGALKGDGMRPGFPDLICVWKGGIAFIEVKRAKLSKTSPEQEQMLSRERPHPHWRLRERLRDLPDNSVDSCVCDPPYHLTSIVKRFGAENAAPAKVGKTGAYARASRASWARRGTAAMSRSSPRHGPKCCACSSLAVISSPSRNAHLSPHGRRDRGCGL